MRQSLNFPMVGFGDFEMEIMFSSDNLRGRVGKALLYAFVLVYLLIPSTRGGSLLVVELLFYRNYCPRLPKSK